MWNRVALVVGGVLVTLAVSEALLRLRPVTLAHDWLFKGTGVVVHPDLIYAKRQHLDPAYYRRREGLPNLIALGDSFTGGFPVSDRHSYPARLERMLARKGAAMNVINLGLGDSGPDQHLRLFAEQALRHVRPDIVIWEFYANDMWDNVEKPVYTLDADGRLAPISARRNWIYWRQRLYELTPLPSSFKLDSALYRNLLKASEAFMKAQVPSKYERNYDWSLEKIKAEVAEMHRLGREHGFRTYFLVVPPQAAYVDAKLAQGSDLGEIRRRDAEVRAIIAQQPNFIDFRLPKDGAEPVAERFFARRERDRNRFGDRHLNVAGYREMGRQIGARVLADWRSRADAATPRPATH